MREVRRTGGRRRGGASACESSRGPWARGARRPGTVPPEGPQEILVPGLAVLRRPVLLRVLRHDRARLEGPVPGERALHDGATALAEEIGRDPAEADRKAGLAVGEEEPLLEGRRVLLERASHHHSAEPVGLAHRLARLGPELGRGDEVDHRLADARQDEAGEGERDHPAPDQELASPAHHPTLLGGVSDPRARSSRTRMRRSTRHQYPRRTAAVRAYAARTNAQ